ncbi:hypothetical protein AZE42_08096 [Rhizopogon vesiculosus]|uniref:RanBP2-type domain-containing protein n=1 Tax=Rhizopogon vesiculosus TaxID=180088 RepID=A0A1J8QGD6_9AGAM|nr:hypothetical protein AZE42_08096 [Rhizopogon vesiculosus]
MSADRRGDRRAKRNAHSSPYARRLKPSNPAPKKSLWSVSGLLSFLRLGGAENDDLAEDPVRSDASSSSDDEDEGLQVHEQEPPPSIPVRRVQIDRNSAPEFVLPLPPGDVPPGHEPSQELHYPPAWDAQPGPSNRTSQPVTPTRQPFYNFNTPSQQSHLAPYLQHSPSLARNLEPVTRFLVEKAGQPLNEFEAAGIVDYIQKNVQADKPEPFRFSTSPSRGSSPSPGLGTSNATSSNAHAPKKTLSRNPNGVLRWQGAGSARPRNRYRSPGFGSRPQGQRIKLSPPPPTPSAADTKRRRVGNEAETSTAQKSAPLASTSTIVFPTSSSTSTAHSAPAFNGKTTVPPASASPLAPAAPVAPKVNGAAMPRLRATALSVKPTTPSVPSPLRQAWKHGDSPPQPPTRPTRAANYMTGLIKEVTPPKKPDVSNPYQTANPVKMASRKPTARRLRPPVEKKEKQQKEPEMTAQAIIEATVPKGSKRARPPPEMEKPEKSSRETQDSSAPMVNGNGKAVKPTITVEEVLDQDESPTKKRRTAPAAPPVTLSVEEVVMDVQISPPVVMRPAEIIEPNGDAHWSPTPSASPSSFPHTLSPVSPMKSTFGVKTSAPREPSKLRYSYQADKETASAVEKQVFPPPAPLLAPRTTSRETQTTSPKAKSSAKDTAAAMEIDELPKYRFTFSDATYPAGPSHVKARSAAVAMPVLSLPTFEFKPVATSANGAPSTNGFNWTAAGMKAPTVSSSGTWICSMCMLESPESAKDKCTICDAPRPSTLADAPPQKTFDWSRAAIKPPITNPAGTWQCDTCMLDNPDSAKLKCTVCDAARPGAPAS